MKKLFFLGLLSMAITSCSSNKNATSADSGVTAAQAQTVRADVMKLKGEWTISTVDYNKAFVIKPFDEGADIKCFVGSIWKLVPNNFTGSYAIDGSGSCPSVFQAITFSVDKNSVVSIKKINEGEKAKNVTAGYKLLLENPTDNTFTLVQSVNADGTPMNIRYNFVRISK